MVDSHECGMGHIVSQVTLTVWNGNPNRDFGSKGRAVHYMFQGSVMGLCRPNKKGGKQSERLGYDGVIAEGWHESRASTATSTGVTG